MNRYKAAGLHFLISIFVFAIVLTIMWSLWYPGYYFKLMGGLKLIQVLVGVDVFLGPLLTLIVFNQHKKSLKFDLSCIALLQLIALLYGMYTIFLARPVFTVFNKDKFHVSAVVDITAEELAKAKQDQWRHYSLTGPELVAIGKPKTNDKKELMFAQVESDNAYRYPRLFDEYQNQTKNIIKSGKPLKELILMSETDKQTVSELTKKLNRPVEDFIYFPIYSELAEMTAIVDAKTGKFIDILDIQTNIK